MASNFESSSYKGSDLFFNFSCCTCLGNDRNTEAEFYCEDCSEVYCGKCLEHHNFLYQKHATLGKKYISKWPVPDATINALEQCQVHKDRKLEIFCEDHSELMCTVCHVYNHKKCNHVVLTADKVKSLHLKGEFKQLSATLDTLHEQLILKKDDFEERMMSLEKSCKQILEEINALRKAINDSLDQLEQNTIKDLGTLLAGLKTSIQTDNENCKESIKNMTSIKEDLLNIKDKSEAIQMILYRNCLDQSVKTKAVLQEMTVKNDTTLSFTPDPIIQQTMATISGLGQILIQENTVTRETKPEACSKVPSQNDPENQPSYSNKQSLVSSSISGKPRQADIANKQDPVSNQISVAPKQGDIANQTTDVNKPGHVSNPISNLSTKFNIASDLNTEGQVSGKVRSSSHQLVHGDQPKAISKSDPNQVIRVRRIIKMYSVKTERDSHSCWISAICETATGELLIADGNNKNIKLLDQTFKVVAHLDLPDGPWSMCSIDSSLVAVAVCSHYININNSKSEVHFIRVTNGQMVQDRILKLQHECQGIAHHQGNLYIASCTALFQYSEDGRLVRKMYEDTSSRLDVATCAVSPDGDRIYVINRACKQLVTLSKDGTVISTLTDPALNWEKGSMAFGLHVSDSGQVLLCGYHTNSIIQVDRDGRQRLAKIVTLTAKNGCGQPISVCNSKHKGILFVARAVYNDIIVFFTY